MYKLRLLFLGLGLLLASLILGGCAPAGYYNSGYYPDPVVIILEVPDCDRPPDHGPIVVDNHPPKRKTPTSRNPVSVDPPPRTKIPRNVSTTKKPVVGRGEAITRR